MRTTSGQAKKAGAAPGTVVYTGDRDPLAPIRISVFEYDGEHLIERPDAATEDCVRAARASRERGVLWINVDGVHDTALVQRICSEFQVHSLTVEDICSVVQRPKVEEYPDYVFIVVEMLSHALDGDAPYVVAEQLSMVVGSGFVLTFQEEAGDGWDAIRKRLRNQAGRLRRDGSDYLTYALLDGVVDDYFVVLDALGQEIERYEEEAIGSLDEALLHRVHDLKRQLLLVRTAVWPLREVTGHLVHAESEWIRSSTRPFLRDLHDHVVQVIETTEIYRESAVALVELYLASSGNRLNQVMKMLTLVATIFIPVTFVSSIYGMNFDHMPELHWRLGYPLALLFMWGVAAFMVWYFRREKWL
jgi:magnesium transporter